MRFARLGNTVIAVKETTEHVARHEYQHAAQAAPAGRSLRGTARGGHRPSRRRRQPAGSGPGDPAPEYSLPYRALFSQKLRRDTLTRLIDAQALLLVRLHLVGFYWGDVSLSNTLFRRDAEAFAAYLVDAETGELYRSFPTGSANTTLRSPG